MNAAITAFSYEDIPTCQRFASSNAFMRGLMGPFGCTSGDTEFLTPAGWRRIDEYNGELVAQWNQTTCEIEFVEPEAYVALPCTELIEFDSGSLVMRVSEEHRMPHWNWNKTFQVKTAAEIEKHPSLRTIPTTFRGPRIAGLGMSDDLIRFAVMMHADGHYPRMGKRAAVALRKERKKERLRRLLQRLGIAYDEFTYASRPTETTFRFVAPYVGKRFTDQWWRASAHDLSVVFDEMRHWDGHFDEMLIYSSRHKEDADFIQYAAHACGRRATISVIEPRKASWSRHYRVQIRVADNAKNKAMVRKETRITRVAPSDGKKYCFTVPTGFFVARCDGTVFITGNSAKSSTCVAEIVQRARRQRPGPDGIRRSRWAVIRNTWPELRDTTIRTVFQWLPPQYYGKYVEAKHSYTVKAIPGCEFEILFLALDRPEDIKKLLSLELTGAWVNEAREVPWSVIEALQGRVGRYPAKRDGGPSWWGIWLDTNPPDSDSKWYRYFEDRIWLKDFERMRREGELPASMRPEDFVAIFKQPSGLSPDAENLTNLPGGRRYYTNLAAGKAPEWVTVYVHGSYGFVVEGKLVYPEFSDQVHTRSVDPIEGVIVLRSYDFGLTPACVFSQLLPDGRFLAFDEMTSDNMSVDQFGDEVLEHCNRTFKGRATFDDVGDPAGEIRAETDARTAFDMLLAKGIDIRAAVTQEPRLRQESVRKPLRTLVPGLAEPQFILHPRCKMLRKGFLGGYHRRRMAVKGPERYSEQPAKNEYSHVHDALQYGAAEHFAPALIQRSRDEDEEFFASHHDDVYSRSTANKDTGY